MKIFAKNVLLFFLAILMASSTLLQDVQYFGSTTAKADDTDATQTVEKDIPSESEEDYDVGDQPPKTIDSSITALTHSVYSSTSSDISDAFTKLDSPRIVLNSDDKLKLQSLRCISNLVPDFENNPDATWANLSASDQAAAATKISQLGITPTSNDLYGMIAFRTTDRLDYENYARKAAINWGIELPDFTSNDNALTNMSAWLNHQPNPQSYSVDQLKTLQSTNDNQAFANLLSIAQQNYISNNVTNYSQLLQNQLSVIRQYQDKKYAVMPDFSNDFNAIVANLSASADRPSATTLQSLKSANPAQFIQYVNTARSNWINQNSSSMVPDFTANFDLILQYYPDVYKVISTDNDAAKIKAKLKDIQTSNTQLFNQVIFYATTAWVNAGHGNLMPDFNDPNIIYPNFIAPVSSIATTDSINTLLSAISKAYPKSVSDLQSIKEASLNLKKSNSSTWTAWDEFMRRAQSSYVSINSYTSASNNSALSTMACITQKSPAEIISGNLSDVQTAINNALKATVIDIRTIKALVYLVTPKNQGGAGHWRVNVRRITQLSSTPYSTESDATRTSLGGASQVASASCTADMSAAECGQKQGDNSNVTVEDQNGDNYYASLTTVDSSGNTVDKIPERNVSAHVDGKAFDVMEVDDIRCTLIKYSRKFFSKSVSYEKKDVHPIKLAWQTSQGYSASGGNPTDMLGILKNVAQDSVTNLITSMGGDVSDYNGDLTKANFNDLVGIIGKSLFSQVLNSPGHDLSGYSVDDTIQKLGAMYIADFLGVPKEIFLNRSYDSLEDINALIGEGAIEKKLNLPIGTLDSLNPYASEIPEVDSNGKVKTDSSGKVLTDYSPVYNLEGLLINVGLRKLEFEMGLDPNSLDKLVAEQSKNNPQGTTTQYIPSYVGYRVIEEALNMPQNSLNQAGANFGEFKKNLGDVRSTLLFADPSWMDTLLHLTPGTTKKVMTGGMTPDEYVVEIGQTRVNDTTKGLNYMSVNNAAFNMPVQKYDILDLQGNPVKDTNGNTMQETAFEHALKGYKDAFIDIGAHYLALTFGTSQELSPIIAKNNSTISADILNQYDSGSINIYSDPKDLGLSAFESWIKNNAKANSPDSCALPTKIPIKAGQDTQAVADDSNDKGVKPYYTLTNVNIYSAKNSSSISGFSNGSSTNTQTPLASNLNFTFNIYPDKATSVGFNQKDLYRMFGCSQTGIKNVFERIGSNMLYTAIANKLLNDEDKVRLDLNNLNPSLTGNNFYLVRYNLIKTTVQELQQDFKGHNTPSEQKVIDHLNVILDKVNNLGVTDLISAAGTISHEVELLEDDAQQLERQGTLDINFVNTEIRKVNIIMHAVEEMLQGNTIQTADSLSINQINSAALGGGSASNNSNTGSSSASGALKGSSMTSAIFDFLSRRITAGQLMLYIGAANAEDSLGLPPRTLVYLVQNYLDIGYSGPNALYAAMGQAKIEQAFSLPPFYFQGDTLNRLKPDFKKDLAALNEYVCRAHNQDQVNNNLDKINTNAVTYFCHGTNPISNSNQFDINFMKGLMGQITPKFTYNTSLKLYQPASGWATTTVSDSLTGGGSVNTISLTLPKFDPYNLFNDPNIIYQTNEEYLKKISRISVSKAEFNGYINEASTEWQREQALDLKNRGQNITLDTTLERIAKNVENRKYNDGIRTGTKDVMMRLGFSGELDALEHDFNSAAINQAAIVDNELSVRNGSTQALITQKPVKLAHGEDMMDAEDKNQIVAELGVSATDWDNFLKLLNGDMPISSVNATLGQDFTQTNPYFQKPNDTAEKCPIDYQLTNATKENGQGQFVLTNNSYVAANSYCVYDKTGSHCFKNVGDQQNYIATHINDQYPNLINEIANRLTDSTKGLLKNVTAAQLEQQITDYINGKSDNALTNDQQIQLQKQIDDINNQLKTNPANAEDLDREQNAVDSLLGIFVRNSVKSPVLEFKKAVGKEVAKMMLSKEIFSKFGFDLPSNVFDSADFYRILTGDMRPLYRVGAYFVDKSLDLKSGTTMLVLTAVNPDNLKCALADASATILGNLLGMGPIPIRGNIFNDIPSDIGENQVEQGLGLPTGTFYGDSLDDVIDRVKPITFAIKFNIPFSAQTYADGSPVILWSDSDLANILGQDQANALKDQSGQQQLRAIYAKLQSALGLSTKAAASLAYVEAIVKKVTLSELQLYGNGKLGTGAEEAVFKKFADGLDARFGLDGGKTGDLFAGRMTPDQYTAKMGATAIETNLIGRGLQKIFNWNNELSDEAAKLIVHFDDIFKCSNPDSLGNCPTTTNMFNQGGGNNIYYHNFGKLYDVLSQAFKINLDEKAGLAPGSMAKMLQNPGRAYMVLLENAATKLDDMLNLTTADQQNHLIKFSFSDLYSRYAKWQNGVDEVNQKADDDCRSVVTNRNPGYDYNALMRQEDANDAIIDKDNTQATQAQKDAARASNDSIEAKIKDMQKQIDDCQAGKRTSAAVTFYQNHGGTGNFDVSAEIVDIVVTNLANDIHLDMANLTITENGVTRKVGFDMPVSDIKDLLHGNMTYLEIMGMAVTANLVNNLETNNNTKKAVPANLMITYQDIKQAFFPDQSSIDAAYNAAASKIYYEGSAKADPDTTPMIFYSGDCPAGQNLLDILGNCNTASYANTPISISQQTTLAIQQTIDFKPTATQPLLTYEQAVKANLKNEQDASTTMSNLQGKGVTLSSDCIADPAKCSSEDEKSLRSAEQKYLNAVNTQNNLMSGRAKDADSQLRDISKKLLEYRLMDQILWSADDNIFPGFTASLMMGNDNIKMQALTRYIKNGIMNGHLFGMKFPPVSNIDTYLGVAKLIAEETDPARKAKAFDDFVQNGSLDAVSKWMAESMKGWIGVDLSAKGMGGDAVAGSNIIKGIFVGMFTGQWGSTGVFTDSYYKNNTSVPTLGTAIKSWALPKLFAWTDKFFKFDAGTSYKVYTMAKTVYNAGVTLSGYRNISSYLAKGGSLDSLKDASVAKANGFTTAQGASYADQSSKLGTDLKDNPWGDTPGDVIENMQEYKIAQAQIELISFVAIYFFNKWAGKAMTSIENSLNLVPGSLAILADAAITLGVSYGVAAMHVGIASNIMSAAWGAFWGAVALFVIINIIGGVYKIEYKCGADGYFPEYPGEGPNPTVNDVSGIGEWDGTNQNTVQEKSIEVAKYKARRLDADMLSAQDTAQFSDLKPSQIMTGRQEDVDFLNSLVDSNMCAGLNLHAVNGICGDGTKSGSTQAGMWANPQTVAWTHIGF